MSRVAHQAESLAKAIATQLQACEAILDYARFVEDPFERAQIRMTVGAQASEVNHLIRHHASHMLAVPIDTVSNLKDQHEALLERLDRIDDPPGCNQTLSVAVAKADGLHQRCGRPCYAHESEDAHGKTYLAYHFAPKETP